MYYKLNKNVIARNHYNGNVLILNRKTQEANLLNSSSSYILEHILDGLSIKQIVQKCKKEFGVDEKINFSREIEDIVNQLLENGWIVKSSELCFEKYFIRGKSLKSPIDLVYLELTDKCNLNCLHCYMNANITGRDYKPVDWADVIRQLDELGVLTLVITGGEPTLHQDFDTIIREVKKRGLKFVLFTNGTTLSDKTVKLIKWSEPEYVAISLDGANAETHDKFRGDVAFDRTIKGIKALVKEGIKVRLNITLNKFNREQLNDIVRLASNLGVYKISVEGYSECGRGAENLNERVEYTIGYTVNKKVKSVLSQLETEGLHVPQFGEIVKNDLFNYGKDTFPSCGVGKYIFLIKYNGDITLCTLLNSEEFKAGNILESTIEHIWNNSSLFNELRNFKIEDTNNCFKCENKNNCAGGCRARVYFEHNSLKAQDPWVCQNFNV